MANAPRAGTTAGRLDELEAQAQYARQRCDLYKAKAYGPRLTSPARLRDLEREASRTAANLRFAKAQAKRESVAGHADEPPRPAGEGR
jgi:hypothetical protein